MKRTRINALVPAAAVAASTAASASADPGYDLWWYTIDAGGGTSTGAEFTLSGTVAQADAGSLSGGGFQVEGGFWLALGAAPCPWDCENSPSGDVGVTDFLAMLAQWGTIDTCDFDGNGVGVTDFLSLLGHWGTCPE